jgi:hypothetical protein
MIPLGDHREISVSLQAKYLLKNAMSAGTGDFAAEQVT